MAPRRSRVALPPKFTRGHFRAHARRMGCTLNGVTFGDLTPCENQTGSLGWRLCTKTAVQVGDCSVYAQVDLRVTVIGSAELPK